MSNFGLVWVNAFLLDTTRKDFDDFDFWIHIKGFCCQIGSIVVGRIDVLTTLDYCTIADIMKFLIRY